MEHSVVPGSGENDPFVELRHAEYIRHAIEQVKDLGGTQDENLGTVLGPSDPKFVGPYRILSILGKGGMGKVYMAERQAPIRQRVALKVIKPGMDTEQVLARFEAERQALALLDHSNIAKVFDAGSAEDGHPYFVMEYIDGERITDYCDRHQLDTAARLRLFMQVCEGVQHAHQKTIIHRDIKPSNILVTEQDGKPVPKIIDFGVAKATAQKLTERILLSEPGQIIGTLEYMSREQLRTPHDVDTRTDIYSLGVVLYELLVGVPPFDPSMLRRAAREEMERIIAEEEPPKPSTKLSGLEADSWATVASRRDTAFRSLCKSLHGELDWITMKCLEKERARRYDTANGLGLEIARYLNNEPVLAGPPSATYRFKKFVHRNRARVAALLTIFLVLGCGVAALTTMYTRAAKAERAEELQRQIAEQSQIETNRVLTFLSNDLIPSANPENQGKDVTLREALDHSVSRLTPQFSGQPLSEARVKRAIGGTYFSWGLYEEAQGFLADAAAIYTRELGEGDPRTLEARNAYAGSLLKTDKYDKSTASLRTTLEMRRRMLGDEHSDTLATMADLANALFARGQYGEAESLYRKVLDVRTRSEGGRDKITLSMMNNLGGILEAEEHFDEAESLFRRVLALSEGTLDSDHPTRLTAQNNLAATLADVGRFAEAEEIARHTFESRRRVLGREHSSTLGTMYELANAVLRQGRFAEADGIALEALAIWDAKGTTVDLDRWLTLGTRGQALAGLGRFSDAEPLVVEAFEQIDKKSEVTPVRRHQALEDVIRFYDSWEKADPGKGHDEKNKHYRPLRAGSEVGEETKDARVPNH